MLNHLKRKNIFAVGCPDFPPLEFGRIYYTPRRENGNHCTRDEAFFSCTVPKVPNGPEFIRCQSSGYWTMEPGTTCVDGKKIQYMNYAK